MEKLANFDRERIPERVVHARGASAKGFFEVTHDISHLTCADFLRAPGVQTPVIVRFSTVIHERGSPETLRDPRGFAVKFYTREVRMISTSFLCCQRYQMFICCDKIIVKCFLSFDISSCRLCCFHVCRYFKLSLADYAVFMFADILSLVVLQIMLFLCLQTF